MNEGRECVQTSRLARASHSLGVLSLLMLLLAGWCIVAQAQGHQVLSQEDISGLSLGAVVGQALAAVAALAAFVLGIMAVVDIRRGAGKVKGKGQAVSGLVTGTLTLLPLALAYCVVLPILAWNQPKVESSNNLRQLGLAMHLYHEDYNCFPSPVLRDPAQSERAQPYSWRVALLPYLGEGELFSQYKRDEPWDSPANKAVLAHMPRVFAPPGRVRTARGLTHYQVLVGPGAAFERPDVRVRLTDFYLRGPEHTILVVEAADPVPWTKPDDLSYTPDGPLPKVGGLVGNGFHALFADGSVRWYAAEEQETLRTLVPLN